MRRGILEDRVEWPKESLRSVRELSPMPTMLLLTKSDLGNLDQSLLDSRTSQSCLSMNAAWNMCCIARPAERAWRAAGSFDSLPSTAQHLGMHDTDVFGPKCALVRKFLLLKAWQGLLLANERGLSGSSFHGFGPDWSSCEGSQKKLSTWPKYFLRAWEDLLTLGSAKWNLLHSFPSL